MKVSKLIEKLMEMSPDAEIYFDDGDANGSLWEVGSVEKDSQGDVRLSV